MGRLSAKDRVGTPSPEDCVLTIGSHPIAAVIAEERDPYIYVLIQESPQFWADDRGILRVDKEDIEVLVANILCKEDGDSEKDKPPVFRIGLERLNSARSKGPEGAAFEAPRKTGRRGWSERSKVLFASSVAIGLILVPLLVVTGAWRRHYLKGAQTGLEATAPIDATSARGENSPANQQQEHANGPAGAGPTNLSSSNLPRPSMEVLLLPGVEPFLHPEVADALELTTAQRGVCQRLSQTTERAIADLEKYWEGSSRLELQQKTKILQDAARSETLQLLSEQQRRRWEAMTR